VNQVNGRGPEARSRSSVERLLGRLVREGRSWRTRRRLASRPRNLLVESGVTITGGDRIELGDGVRLMSGSRLWATPAGRITVGQRTFIGSHSWLVSNVSVEVGADVLIAPFCYIQDTDHGFRDPAIPIADQPSESSAIVIEDGVWLGAHCVVTRGVRIGRGAVIGAGSVVTRDIPPDVVAVGAPARTIGRRDGRHDQSARTAVRDDSTPNSGP